jgi:hypothetical protein
MGRERKSMKRMTGVEKALDRAAKVLESEVRRHRARDREVRKRLRAEFVSTGPIPVNATSNSQLRVITNYEDHGFCEDYGCYSLLEFAKKIRALANRGAGKLAALRQDLNEGRR